MTEKTEEEKLLEAAKSAPAPSGDKKSDDDADSRTPEQKIIDELQGKLSEAEKRAKEAEYARDSERTQKDAARKEALTAAEKQVIAQEEAVKSALGGAKSAFEAAQKEWDDAYDSGDRARVRAATEKLNDAQMQLRGAEFNEGNFKRWKETAKAPVVSQTASKFTPKEQDWIDKNPEFNSNSEFRDEVYAADTVARTRGIEIDSDAYFNLIEDRLKRAGLKGERQKTSEPSSEPSPSRSKSSSTAAPPGGTAGATNTSSRKQSITLTPEMREAASIAFPEEYKKDPKAAEEKYAKYRMKMQEDEKAKKGA